ncbi:uncharacterized protein LOC119629719 [Bombyx mori]|uniref:Reverse transcriptase domain-containing protein n=1 Tax=Bombyx mori TaxID=7091 RepID=A0A8R2M1R7_BOMMO|nr:uncharacterized protein LOC119629719 [Bombyx mori]
MHSKGIPEAIYTKTEALWQEFVTTSDRNVALELIESLNEARQAKWESTVQDMNFALSSRKAWHLLKRFTSGTAIQKSEPKVCPSKIADRIVKLSKAPSHKKHTREVRKDLESLKTDTAPGPYFSRPVTADEITASIRAIKGNKACGKDKIFPELIKHSGPHTREWLAKFFTNIVDSGKIPLAMKRAKITAILKPAAYDTVWRQGLLYKLLKLIPYIKIYKVIEDALTNRPFRVHLGDKSSLSRVLNNGLPQGSVLTPTLFNVYTHDLPETLSRKFAYADDLALVAQGRSIETTESHLYNDMTTLDDYFIRWRLCPNASRTQVCYFHLNNRQANKKPNVTFRGSTLPFNPCPKYLGVTLDRSLTYSAHLNNVAAKLRTRNNMLKKLTGTTWGMLGSDASWKAMLDL